MAPRQKKHTVRVQFVCGTDSCGATADLNGLAGVDHISEIGWHRCRHDLVCQHRHLVSDVVLKVTAAEVRRQYGCPTDKQLWRGCSILL